MFDGERPEIDTAHGIWFRMRRLRESPTLRNLLQETRPSVQSLVQPLFVRAGVGVREPIASMPGQFRFSVDEVVTECQKIAELGIPAVLLFGIPDRKDDSGREASNSFGVVQHAIREIKKTVPDLLIATDICLCGYTTHGHCGLVREKKGGGWDVENDLTLEVLGKIAISHAEAGADIVAPSAMMDGQVGMLRDAMNHEGQTRVSILAYSAKFASAFYGPFREAADSAPSFGDRKSYQMNPANFQEAMREIELDIQEGADIVMVKPALPYLDIIHAATHRFEVPIAAYHVSGEYAMVKAAAANGWLDEVTVRNEIITCIQRAGAQIVITYFAKSFAEDLKRRG